MKISFREFDNGLKNEIAYNNDVIGHVEKNIFTQKWKISPSFDLLASSYNALSSVYESAYEAGKTLANMYEAELYYKEDHMHDLFETQPIDMRHVWQTKDTSP